MVNKFQDGSNTPILLSPGIYLLPVIQTNTTLGTSVKGFCRYN